METRDINANSRSLFVSRFRLVVVDGGETREFVSERKTTIVGSHRTADMVVDDPAISRFHCHLKADAGYVEIRDLSSRNGTIVNGVAIQAAYLRGGEFITLGTTRLRFEVMDDAVEVELSMRRQFGNLRGASEPMRSLFAILERGAKSSMSVLILGESGTGKEVCAESIHLESDRAEAPFVVVDCGAIPADLLESELFGHERGAFTGAVQRRIGAFEAASGGTLFLDEIGELNRNLQPKLLRALDSHSIQRVGGSERIEVDLRIVAATRRDLRNDVNEGLFRSDLFFRLAVLEVTLPPLRTRLEDLELLVEHFLEQHNASESGIGFALRSAQTLAELAQHRWPGNVRELRNYVDRCIALQTPSALVADLAVEEFPVPDVQRSWREERSRWLAAFEKRYLDSILRRFDDNVSAASRAAGLGRAHFHRLLSRYGLR